MRIEEFSDPDLMSRFGNSSLPLTPSAPRTLGVTHLSDVYKALMIRREPERFDPSRPMDMLRVEIGLLFEAMLERALAEKFATSRPGEIVSDEGIFMSPDGVNPTLNAGEEFKSTYLSCSKGISETVIVNGRPTDQLLSKFHHWGLQMLGYSKWLDTKVFILRVLFLCGDYSRPIAPQFKNYRLEFTQQEIDDNWALLMSVARDEGLLAA